MAKTIAVLGGDRRNALLAAMLSDDGYEVCTWGLEAFGAPSAVTLETAVRAQVILLPIPLSKEGKLTGSTLTVEELFSQLSPEQEIYAGGIRAADFVAASARDLMLSDYMDREDFTVQNVIPTAEGAIELALGALPVTLHSCPCLVLGYGRIGKLLAHRLQALGAKVSVSARKRSDLAWIDAFGYEGLHSERLSGRLGDFRVVFNTVPHLMLPAALLSELRRDCVLIELASVSGFDTAAAKELGLQLVPGGGLPGRTAPETAAAAMKRIVLECLEET